MTETHRSARDPSRNPTPEGEALYELMVQLMQLSYPLRAIGRHQDGVAGKGSGLWVLLRALKVDGPRTVPQIARRRGVARQHIQKLVNEASAAGFVRFRVNPDHKRSKIVALTAEGAGAFEAYDAQMREAAEDLSGNLDIRDLDAALRVMFELLESLKALRA